MFCPLPFVHLSIEPNGITSPCCNTPGSKILGNSNETPLFDIFKSQELIDFQKKFINSETLPPECYQCAKLESANQFSMRQAAQQVFGSTLEEVEEGKLKYLGLRFDNVCNLKCRICSPDYSSRWVSDYKALGKPIKKEALKAFPDEEVFGGKLDEVLSGLSHLYVAGGEPFLSGQFFEVLRRLKEMNNLDLEITINSNATLHTYKGTSIYEYLKGFKKVSLAISIDGVGKKAEYMRPGVSWDEICRSIDEYLKWDEVDLFISPTVSNLSFSNLPELCDFALNDIGLDPILVQLAPVFEPAYFRISQIPDGLKKKIQNDVLADSLKLVAGNNSKNMVLFKQLKSMVEVSKDEFNPQLHKQWRNEIDSLDKIRNENFLSVFPDLEELYNYQA
ncbi:MAG: twitch domain-containing radical SAM protein [Halobacteriovoraceae bacterium]|nr:twitch domain-containing radical SAM protein [Halobacteriovoraceae bacterium]